MRKTKTPPLIEFKGTTLPVVAVTLRSLAPAELAAAAGALFGDDAFFDGDAAVLELAQAGEAEAADWASIAGIFASHGLHLIGVRGGGEALRQSAGKAGLLELAAVERNPRAPAPSVAAEPPAAEPAAPPPPPIEPPPPARGAVPTLVIDRPLRSGQQVYARGGDLVVLAAVSAGAEVIADGSIHCYGPLLGRALAGAQGNTAARIITTYFGPELVSIAGIYRTFEQGIPESVGGRPAHVRLNASGNEQKLGIEPLQLD